MKTITLTLKGKELVQQWIKVLRSNTYQQAFGVLKGEEDFKHESYCFSTYCSVGVLLELISPDGWIKDRRQTMEGADRIFHTYFHKSSDGEDGVSAQAAENYGIPLDLLDWVTFWNDKYCYTFDVIADMIEQSIPYYF